MFNGYNDSALISYELNQEREKKSDTVPKYSYGHDGAVHSTPTHPSNRQSEFWSGKSNFVGIPNVVKCNCTGCYPTTENQSYQVESTRHRPWLPKTFPVPLNGSNECKLPPYQWDGSLNQICYSDPNVPYGQENGGKHTYYRQFQTTNQPGVIISSNKQKNEMGFQNGVRQPVMCNPGFDLTKPVNGRSYYDGEKYSLGAHSMTQIHRLPVEPYTKTVPSNLNQNRVPSTGHRKENSPQYDHYNGTKMFTENYLSGPAPMDLKNSGIHVDYSYFNRDSDCYRNNYTEMKRNGIVMQNRKDCAVTQANLEQHYGRLKHPENLKSCEMFYPNLEKNQMEGCIQRTENDGMNRTSRSVMVCNDLRYPEERPQMFSYQNNAAFRNYIRPEYPQFSAQCIPGFQETDKNQCRTLPQQFQNCNQHVPENNTCIVDPQKGNSNNKTQLYGRPQHVIDAQPKPTYLETIRSEELIKNGTNKISPLRLLRKKKFVTAPQELSSATSTLETPTLDVRKFWSTWAEEDENVSPTQMVVLDCQNIDPEQAKLLNFYETDPSRPINVENVIFKNSECLKDNIENIKATQQPVNDQEKQVEIPVQIEPVIKNADEVIPELETVNKSPKKCRSHEHQKSKIDETMDKWTEKKFDFLKRSEESKAAEIIRYEEEKKKIFERRLSFHQINVNKTEKLQEDIIGFEENPQSRSPKERRKSDLPTSEYRRNKFLEYSEVALSGCKNNEENKNREANQLTEPIMVKKEKLDIKNEDNSSLEMDDIFKNISDINFQEMKLESGPETSKKAKKAKKKKSEQLETDPRTDLKLETVSKPTIKFSIQKSHDLKISFKVLNKKYEEEEVVQTEETKSVEDVNTELITLKYKAIQNGGKLSDLKKKRGKLRRNKQNVPKIKKNRYTEEEKDPLAEDNEGKTYPDDGFQVLETVDSAKIKLTFKRHKTNLETEYKIDNEGLDVNCEDYEKNSDLIEDRHRKKSRKAKRHKFSPQAGIDSSNLEPQSKDKHPCGDCSSDNTVHKNCLESSKEDSEKVCLSCSVDEEKVYENSTTPLGMGLLQKRSCELAEEVINNDSKCETDSGEHVDLIVKSEETIKFDDKHNFLPDEDVGEGILKSSNNEEKMEETQEISLDFITVINSPDVDIKNQIEKTEKIEGHDATEEKNKNGETVIESTNENHSTLQSSYDLKKILDCLEVQTDPRSILINETTSNVRSNSHEAFSNDMTRKDIFNEDLVESRLEPQNICCLKTESKDESLLNPGRHNFVEYDSLNEKPMNLESDTEKTVECDIPKVVDNESTIGLEDILTVTVAAEESENHFESSEGYAKIEPEIIQNSDQVHLMLEEIGDKEHSELSKLKMASVSPPNEDVEQSKVSVNCDGLIDCNQIDELIEPGHTIKGGSTSVGKLMPVENESTPNAGNENKFDSESQNIESPKFEESKTSAKDEAKPTHFNDREQNNFLNESELYDYTSYEKVDKFYELDVSVHDNKFSNLVANENIKSDDTLSGKSDISSAEQIRDSSFIEQAKTQNVNFENKNQTENKVDSQTFDFENINQSSELINRENTPQGLDIDQLIHMPDDMSKGSDSVTEQGTEFSNSHNPPSDESTKLATKLVGVSPTIELDTNNEKPSGNDLRKEDEEIDVPEVEFDVAMCDKQNAVVSSEDKFKTCLEEETERNEPPEASSSFDNVQGGIVSETSNHAPDDFTTYDLSKDGNLLEVVNNFENDTENCEQTIYLEKLDEDHNPAEVFFLNDKEESLFSIKSQHTIMVENQARSSVCDVPPVSQSQLNSSSTASIEMKLKDETDFERNSLHSAMESESKSLELPQNQESELEDGEIVDGSSDVSEFMEQTVSPEMRKTIEFKVQKPLRRHSVSFYNTESPISSFFCQRRLRKSNSCPSRLEVASPELNLNILVEDIPLPMGPPPLNSCFSFRKFFQMKGSEEAKELDRGSTKVMLETRKKETAKELPCGSPFGAIELPKCRNPSPPRSDALATHRSKIKFSLTRRSRFSKVALSSGKPKIMENLTFFKKPEPDTNKNNQEPKVTKIKEPQIEVFETEKKQELIVIELSEKSNPKITESEKNRQKIFEVAKEAEIEVNTPFEKPNVEISERFGKAENADELSKKKPEIIDSAENLELQIVEMNVNISTTTEPNKVRTPDYMSETIEEMTECQIAEVPKSSSTQTNDKDQKSDLEVESLCEDANVEIVDVMNDFMRDEFYEDIPTSEDLPNGDSVDEKVNDDKFRNIMQNCLENAKKFLNVGNLKLFSCSVEDLLEIENQDNEPAANHISRDVLLTSCEDINDDLVLNEKFQPVDISMEFVPSDVCPEILPVDNWPYLEEEVPSSPLKSNEADLILENTMSEVIPNRTKAAKESEKYKPFRRKSLADEEETLGSKAAAHRRKTIDGFESFLTYTKFNGFDKPNESLKCRLSLEKLTKNGVEFICPQNNLTKKLKDIRPKKKLNYKSPLWQPKVMLIRISDSDVKRFKKTKIRTQSAEDLNSLPAVKRPKLDHVHGKGVEDEVVMSAPSVNSTKGQITRLDVKKPKPRFRNLHTKRKLEQEETQPKAVESALSELFKDSDEESKNVKLEKTNKSTKIAEPKPKSESKSDRHSLKYHSHKDKHDHRDKRRESDKEHHRHKEKQLPERSKHDEGKRHRISHSDDDRKRSFSKDGAGQKEAGSKEDWVCEVCGFNESSERVAHIKNHPFHCQSCHLAFKTEAYFTDHLTQMHKDIRNQHHCLLCELSFDTEEEYQNHLETREHTHLEAVEKNTINTLFTLLTGAPCPVLGLVDVKPEWLPNQPGTVHFYHQATPLSLALQYLKMNNDLASYSEVTKVQRK